MTDNTDPALDVQRLMHEIRASVASQHLPTDDTNLPSPGPSNGNLSPDNHYHVNDLLRFHGDDFVRNAYRALLGREPDEAGMAQHLAGLSSGRFNKIDVLASLQRSPEGRRNQVRVDGLSLPVAVRKLGRVPVIGYFIRLLVGVFRLPRLIQYQNQFEFYTWSQQKRIMDQQDQRHSEFSAALNQISVQMLESTQVAAERQQAYELSLSQHDELVSKLESTIEVRLADTRKYIDESKQQLAEQISLLSQQLRDQHQHQQQMQSQTQQLVTEQQRLAEQQVERIQPLVLRQQKAEVELLMQERRLTILLEQVRRDSVAMPSSSTEVAASEEDHLHDALYASFEDEFRGPRDEVRRRLQVYVPILKEARISEGVLDVGCGRGEWLELLHSEGIKAQGVDRNRVFIQQCRNAGLNVVEEDAMVHLRGLPEESLSAVTAFHFVEHVPFEVLIRLLDEIVRVLKPGGLLIVETPNPENFMVGSCSFYADPTHRNPIPSQTLRFFLEARGLENTRILKLRPWDAAKIEGDTELIKRFNEYFYSGPDYGIIASKPLIPELTPTDVQ